MSYKSENLLNLGKKTLIPDKPSRKLLEKVKNPKINVKYCIRLSCPEFTSICPITSQPDFEPIGFIIMEDDKYAPIKSI